MTSTEQLLRTLEVIDAADMTDTQRLGAQMLAMIRRFLQEATPEELEAAKAWPDDLILRLGRSGAMSISSPG